jgi:protein TonB
MKKPWDSWLSLVLVIALHAGAIGVAVWAPSPKTEELVLPTVQGIIIPAPPAETVQMPSARETPPPVEPPPPEPEKPKPKPKKVEPTPKPKPKPVIEAPPSERAITQEETPQEESAPPPQQPVSTPLAEENDTMGAPVTPPREDAHQLNNPRPAYPSLSRRLREQGTVLLEILIEPDGSVGEVRIKESSGFKRLDDTAVKAVKQWKYTPAKRGNEPIAYWYLQPLEFSLR